MNDLHHNCEQWAEPISLLAAGCLTTDEARDVRRHCETCLACRERLEQLTKLCGALAEPQFSAHVAEDTLVERVMSTVTTEKVRRPIADTPTEMIQPTFLTRSRNRWRWIMRSPVSRIAAAAIFVLAVSGVAMIFQGGGGTAFAFDDFAGPVLEAKTIQCTMTIEMKGPPARTMTGEVMTLDGARMRQVTRLPDVPTVVTIQDFSQGKSLILVPASKTATVHTSTPNRKDNSPESGGLLTLIQLFQFVAEENPGIKHESLGEKEIEGRKVVGFHILSQPHDLILWGDPMTGLPVRVEITMGVGGSMKTTFSDFVFNADLDESLFSLEPPAGYTVAVPGAKADVSSPQEEDLIEMFREYSKLNDDAFPDSLDFLTTSTIVGKKASIRMMTQNFWQQKAPANSKPSEAQKREFEELMEDLMLKLSEGKLNEGEIAEQVEEFMETHSIDTAEGRQARSQENDEFGQAQVNEILRQVQQGLNFAMRLPPTADAHYVGKGVSFGAADTPIFWYRTKESGKYRVVLADLSVLDSDTPPNITREQ